MSDYVTELTERDQISQGYLRALRQNIERLNRLREQIGSVIAGQTEMIDLAITALLCEGHVLLEGVPGLGKTLMVRTLADSLALKFSRIQFTPDLLPADITGTIIAAQEENNRLGLRLRFEPGPIFANLVLADEINRASPKTQSALLEAMQEQAVTAQGQRHPLPRPFQVLATQNPLEMEGTYPLPEAQVDRFLFKILVKHPSEAELITIINRTVGAETPQVGSVMEAEELNSLQRAVREVLVPPHVAAYAARLTLATQPEQAQAIPAVRKYVRYGAGPRGAQALILAGKARALTQGRFNACVEDVQQVAAPALRHRIAINFDGLMEGVKVDSLLQEIIQNLPVEITPDRI
ncbi:MAG: AAA family ATPase [Firmicutes bacterium]|nr:AAA family ATPase [Bacillota bacterium]